MPLYALGSNGSGQLGVGHTNDLSSPEPVQGSETWSIKQVAAGGNHTVLLCSDGKVRATGNNEDSRAAICGRSTYSFLEMPVWEYNYRGTLEVRQLACTWSATFLLLADGTVHACGSGDSGELGLGNDVVGSKILRKIPHFPPEGHQAVSISACMGHVVVVLSDGSVYGWGKGRKGQLGEPAEDVWTPRRIEIVDFRATEVACGKDFTIIVGAKPKGEVKMFGPTGRDRFGIKSGMPQLAMNVKELVASWGSVYALCDNGAVQAWGRDDHGQLPPKGIPEIAAIAAGSEHTLALTKSGKVSAWGWGEHGNCGKRTDERGDVKSRWNEVEVPGQAVQVFAGCATSFIVVAG